ncbi:MAG: hypothetical protein IT179_10755 [Acidobacteria bacterium]|nr:hypothetical protein [Acidobacteriota bacterium]
MPLFDATVRGGTLVAPVNVHVATLKATETPGMPDVSLAFNHLGFCGFEMLPNHGALVGVQAALEPWDWGRRQAVALAEGAHPTVTGA